MKNKMIMLSAVSMLLLIVVAPTIVVTLVQLLTVHLAGGRVSQYAGLIIMANVIGIVVDFLTSFIDKIFELLLKRWAGIYLVMLLFDWLISAFIMGTVNALWFHQVLSFQMLGVLTGVGSIMGGIILWLVQRLAK